MLALLVLFSDHSKSQRPSGSLSGGGKRHLDMLELLR